MEPKKNMEKKILKIAEQLFVQHGYNNTSTTMIAKKIGVNQALIYYYYRSKERLLEAVVQSKKERIQQLIGAVIVDDKLPFFEKIEFAIRRHFDFFKSNAKFFLFVNGDLMMQPKTRKIMGEFMEQTIHEITTALEGPLRNEAATGHIRPVKAGMLLTTIFSLNAAPFAIKPVLERAAKGYYDTYEDFLTERLEENVRIVLALLHP